MWAQGCCFALLAILAFMAIHTCGQWARPHGGHGGHSGACGHGGHPHHHGAGFAPGGGNPYAAAHRRLDAQRGQDRSRRAGGELRPEHFAEAEREQWYAATEADHTGAFDAEQAHSDAVQYHTTQPAIDYSSFITSQVVDPRTQSNHARWASEMKPWSGTAMVVDDMDEALEASTHFTGLRRPQAIVQNNPLQLTEQDSRTFSGNSKFNFKG
jgi:hypothetical protein